MRLVDNNHVEQELGSPLYGGYYQCNILCAPKHGHYLVFHSMYQAIVWPGELRGGDVSTQSQSYITHIFPGICFYNKQLIYPPINTLRNQSQSFRLTSAHLLSCDICLGLWPSNLTKVLHFQKSLVHYHKFYITMIKT